MKIAKEIKLGEPKAIDMTLILTYLYITYPSGIFKKVLVFVDGLIFPEDFKVVDMKGENESFLVLGSPFLANGKALMDIELGELMLHFKNENVLFNACE